MPEMVKEPQERREKIPEPVEKPKTRRWLWPAVGFFLIVAAAVGYIVWTRISARESADDAQIDAHISPISPRVGGTVISVYVNDNQEVTAGQTLFQIDPTDYKIAVDQAAGELADAQSAARAAQSSVPVTSIGTTANVSTATAGVREAQAGLATA